jgi:hypothetical protein
VLLLRETDRLIISLYGLPPTQPVILTQLSQPGRVRVIASQV